jgi:hypothetical protein
MYTDMTEVMQGHLEEMHRALNAAYIYHEADDVCREQKNIGGVHRQSNLTKALETAANRVEGYLTGDINGTIPQDERLFTEPDGTTTADAGR